MRRLLLMAIAFIAFMPLAARADEPVCGSTEAFKQTRRWQDLPGCTEERDYDDSRSPVTLLGRAKDAFKTFFEHWEKGEIDEAESAVGGCYAYMNGADEDWATNPELAAARPAYEEMKRRVEQYMDWAPLVKDLAQSYFKTVTWVEESHKGNKDAPDMALMSAKELRQVMDRAAAAHVPDTFVVPGIGLVKPASVAEIKTLIAPLLGDANNAVAKAKAEDDAKWAPYTSLLHGERLKFFNETYRIGTNVYGVGGRYLDTPEEFRTTSLMCTISYGGSESFQHWTLRCYSFRGDRMVSGPRTSSGYGSPPSGAYR